MSITDRIRSNAKIIKLAFTPTEAMGQSNMAPGGPPMDPAMAGGMPPGAGAPPGGLGMPPGAPPVDPAMAGGMPPGVPPMEMSPEEGPNDATQDHNDDGKEDVMVPLEALSRYNESLIMATKAKSGGGSKSESPQPAAPEAADPMASIGAAPGDAPAPLMPGMTPDPMAGKTANAHILLGLDVEY